MVAAGKETAGRHSRLHGDLGRDRKAIGAPANAIGSEQLSVHGKNLPSRMVSCPSLAAFVPRLTPWAEPRGAPPGPGARPGAPPDHACGYNRRLVRQRKVPP